MEQTIAVGRRKTSVARIYMKQGKGNITVNKLPHTQFFPYFRFVEQVEAPLKLLEVRDNYDIKVTIKGGGFKGQAEALQLAVARALVKINEEDKKQLKDNGYLVRDPRAVERKKSGQPKARKKFQFSKR